jgi:hypothetical protein
MFAVSGGLGAHVPDARDEREILDRSFGEQA